MGDYNVYVRRRLDSQYDIGSSNSVWVGLDGISTDVMDNYTEADVWIWKNLGTVKVSSAGRKMLDIVRREDGYIIDRVVLTQGAIPTGIGPEESLRSFNGSLTEFSVFSSQWFRSDCAESNEYCIGADIDKDNDVDIYDLLYFADNWLYSQD